MSYTKVTRDEIASYLDTTPSSTATWAIIGIGITGFGQSYNPQVSTEKWIVNKNSTSSVDSYQIQGDASQKIYKGDACFEYINELRRTAGIGSSVETHILDIDIYDTVSAGVYKATEYDCVIAITKYNDENAVIEYSIYYNGDPILGTVTFIDEVPTFTTSTSL